MGPGFVDAYRISDTFGWNCGGAPLQAPVSHNGPRGPLIVAAAAFSALACSRVCTCFRYCPPRRLFFLSAHSRRFRKGERLSVHELLFVPENRNWPALYFFFRHKWPSPLPIFGEGAALPEFVKSPGYPPFSLPKRVARRFDLRSSRKARVPKLAETPPSC